jgi:ABC-type multidrug transport system permease subunit
MWWGIGFGGFFLYLLLLIFLGIRTLRNGHGWMFFFGIFFPLLWLFGAFMRPARPQAA